MNFKVGDWVEIFSSIHQIEIIDYEDESSECSRFYLDQWESNQ